MVVGGWHGSARCNGDRTLDWDADEATEQHVTFCFSCVVSEQCLAHALSQPADEIVGVWAGTGKFDRTRVRRTAK